MRDGGGSGDGSANRRSAAITDMNPRRWNGIGSRMDASTGIGQSSFASGLR